MRNEEERSFAFRSVTFALDRSPPPSFYTTLLVIMALTPVGGCVGIATSEMGAGATNGAADAADDDSEATRLGDAASMDDDSAAAHRADGAYVDAETPTDGAAEARPPDAGADSPRGCAGTCSGRGTCVLVDDAPTCACESGFYSVDLECLRDPCAAGGTCYYVDARNGNDGNVGTAAAPWRSIDRVNAAMGSFGAGDYVLFQRGREWTTTLRANRLRGSAGAPITFGAYGEGARPRVMAIRVENSDYVTIRDFEQFGSPDGPCTNVTHSGYVILQDLHVHDCSNNGLSFQRYAHHGVMIGNRVWNIPANDALSIHNSSTGVVGDHHWIVDNVVTGRTAEQPIDIATGRDDIRGSHDLKVVGNRLRGGGNGCIVLGHGSSMGWVVGNYAAQCTRSETAYATSVSGSHGARSGSHFYVVGNVTFSNMMSSLQIAGEDPSVPLVFSHHNTYVHTGQGRRPVVRSSRHIDFTMHHNIVWPTGSQAHVALRSTDDVTAMNDNWYVAEASTGCRILGRSLSEWQAMTSHDSRSSCGAIPGMTDPTTAQIADVDVWGTAAFRAHFVPDATWEGCASGIGAFDCAGNQHIEFEPFADFADDNGGYGWAGPLIVRQRYPIGP